MSADPLRESSSLLFIFYVSSLLLLWWSDEWTNSLYRLKPVDDMIYSRTSQKVLDRESGIKRVLFQYS